MTATWMAYVVALSACAGLAALLVERIAVLLSKPRRPVWAIAILASLIVPITAPAVHRTSPPPSTPEAVAEAPGVTAQVPVVQQAQGVDDHAWRDRLVSLVRALDRPLLFGWWATSLLLALGLLRSNLRLHRRARAWRQTVVDGVSVLAAGDLGPAVVRLHGLEIVLPEWALGAEPEARSLMLLHEQEHRRERDPDLLLGAMVALVLAPWNLALWWQVRRLRLAVETDCDSRVMRKGANANAYGVLLLSVGARGQPQSRLTATAFSEAPSLLERRIEAMTSVKPRNPLLQGAVAAIAVGIVLVTAAMVPQPARPYLQPTAASSQGDPSFDVLLRVRSTTAGREVRFKAGYDVDDRAGLQFVEATTPYQVAGHSHGATAILQKLAGDGDLEAALIVGTGADTQNMSAAAGPRLVLRYQPSHFDQVPGALPCRPPHIEWLQALARSYHPEIFAPSAAHDSALVGFVFDSTCHVVRHAIGRRSTSDHSQSDQFARLFPGIGTGPRYLLSAGNADAVPSQEPGHPFIVWGVLKR